MEVATVIVCRYLGVDCYRNRRCVLDCEVELRVFYIKIVAWFRQEIGHIGDVKRCRVDCDVGSTVPLTSRILAIGIAVSVTSSRLATPDVICFVAMAISPLNTMSESKRKCPGASG